MHEAFAFCWGLSTGGRVEVPCIHYAFLKGSEASVDFGTFGKETPKSVTCVYQGSVVPMMTVPGKNTYMQTLPWVTVLCTEHLDWPLG